MSTRYDAIDEIIKERSQGQGPMFREQEPTTEIEKKLNRGMSGKLQSALSLKLINMYLEGLGIDDYVECFLQLK